MTAHQSVGAPYGIKGFPTIKFFGYNKNKPTDYNGQRTADALGDESFKQLRLVQIEHACILLWRIFAEFFFSENSPRTRPVAENHLVDQAEAEIKNLEAETRYVTQSCVTTIGSVQPLNSGFQFGYIDFRNPASYFSRL